MRGYVIERNLAIEEFPSTLVDVADPKPGTHEVLVEIQFAHLSACSFIDL
jgi:NADPH:quinone reductase-like Zn-dependent oxidoreductase